MRTQRTKSRTSAVPLLCVVATVALILNAGCNRGPKCYPISGKVTWKGQPVSTGTVTFVPDGGGRPATGKLSADGTYELSTFEKGDGAQAGEYVVLIESVEYPETGEVVPKTFAEEVASENAPAVKTVVKPPKWLVPETYSAQETTPLKASVSEKTTMDFDLPDGAK